MKWKKISFYVAMPIIGAMTVINVGIHIAHGHHEAEDTSEVSYMKIRTKPYPWSCPDCSLFEGPCWDKCNAAKKAA